MNHMEEIAKMLGVKFGEVFKIDIGGILFETKYYLGELGLFMVGGNKLMTGTLNGILNGRYKIVKIPQNILTEKEKKYLSDFIDPFKSQVTYIEKRYFKDFKGNEKEFISIITCKHKANTFKVFWLWVSFNLRFNFHKPSSCKV